MGSGFGRLESAAQLGRHQVIHRLTAAHQHRAARREGDRAGRSLFALANQEINHRLHEVYRGLPRYSMSRFGEATPEQEIV